MADERPSAAQREALQLLCVHGPLSTAEIGGHLVAARGPGSHPSYRYAIAEMAGILAWRLAQRGLIKEVTPAVWTVTDQGRAADACLL
ncbi:hypothetical protein [Actinocorallia libanotica]|uniref:Uncharacterized protein n=1 Tax=Actinocorallia libanotica TaxID=46162 RepID=A0ABP4BYZ9_9ACTN